MAVGANLAFAPRDQSRFVKEGGYKIRPYVKNRIYEKQGRFPGPVFFYRVVAGHTLSSSLPSWAGERLCSQAKLGAIAFPKYNLGTRKDSLTNRTAGYGPVRPSV